MKNLISSQSLGTFPSPGIGASNYQDKGWSSERVPRPTGSSRRHISALTPFYSGRTLPSKWEDAERWICSPVIGYGLAKNPQSQSLRRAKSKSGPIVPPGMAYYSSYSPSMQGLDGGSVRNLLVNSPFSTGVLMPGGVGFHYNGRVHGELANVVRSSSVPAWSDLVSELSLPGSPDAKPDDVNEAENTVHRDISRRDMATQMSPENTSSLSPASPVGGSSPPCVPPLFNAQIEQSAKLEVREVQVDKRATTISWSKRDSSSSRTQKGVPDVENSTVTEVRSSSWDILDAASDISKLQREEARIAAWENLQKAKAEAAIRRLEMKLEKKRSSSMDMILNKLSAAQMKAKEMRSSMSDRQEEHQIPKMSHKITFFQKHFRLSSLGSCFRCHSY